MTPRYGQRTLLRDPNQDLIGFTFDTDHYTHARLQVVKTWGLNAGYVICQRVVDGQPIEITEIRPVNVVRRAKQLTAAKTKP